MTSQTTWRHRKDEKSHLSFIDEVDERGSLNLNLISGPVENLQHEVKKIWLSQIRRRLFREFDSTDSTTAEKK